ncbi:unnamed protein product [Arctogadus glacialis]
MIGPVQSCSRYALSDQEPAGPRPALGNESSDDDPLPANHLDSTPQPPAVINGDDGEVHLRCSAASHSQLGNTVRSKLWSPIKGVSPQADRMLLPLPTPMGV